MMRVERRRAATAAKCGLIGLGALVLALAPTLAQAQRVDEAQCRAAVEARLDKAGIAAAEIRDVDLVRRSSGSEASRTVGYAAWVKLERCQGSVVVNLDTECGVQDVYSSGACSIR